MKKSRKKNRWRTGNKKNLRRIIRTGGKKEEGGREGEEEWTGKYLNYPSMRFLLSVVDTWLRNGVVVTWQKMGFFFVVVANLDEHVEDVVSRRWFRWKLAVVQLIDTCP
ncbi:ninja-family protein AFP3-like [Iris pallida]|uniref:Ninja-family protein AFP3-like n=1 Tax=Iris pallida TaxID=29817 RepID=A0AAX6GZ84_IRIPA|nr:ninja-family protein AFP3-like [Iris pallida]